MPQHGSGTARGEARHPNPGTPLADAWREWAESFAWDHFCTLEFPPAWRLADPDAAFRRLQVCADSVTRESQGPVPWFAVAERHADGRIHLHALLRGTAGIDPDRLIRRWERRNGGADIQRYDPSGGAAGYTVKDVPHGQVEWRFSDGFVRAMHRLDRRDSESPDGTLAREAASRRVSRARGSRSR
jgi:hypothetical protein